MPRRSAWARSMLLLFRISSGSGTLESCAAGRGGLQGSGVWRRGGAAGPTEVGHLGRFNIGGFPYLGESGFKKKKHEFLGFTYSPLWFWVTEGCWHILILITWLTTLILRRTQHFLVCPAHETQQVTSRHVWTFSWQSTMNLPSLRQVVSLLKGGMTTREDLHDYKHM